MGEKWPREIDRLVGELCRHDFAGEAMFFQFASEMLRCKRREIILQQPVEMTIAGKLALFDGPREIELRIGKQHGQLGPCQAPPITHEGPYRLVRRKIFNL